VQPFGANVGGSGTETCFPSLFATTTCEGRGIENGHEYEPESLSGRGERWTLVSLEFPVEVDHSV
jgi:hypothetical protein